MKLPRFLVIAVLLGLLLWSVPGFSDQPGSQDSPHEGTAVTHEIDLSTHRWTDRLLLLFAPDTADQDYQKIVETLSQSSSQVRERDLRLYHLFFEERGSFEDQPLSSEAAQKLASDLGVSQDRFTVLLVGKDGGVKMRSSDPEILEDIFARIDSMPMRQREMREQ